MDKVTRMLMLYQKLNRGNAINKLNYAMEFGITERSFDRDMADMRCFLSETFSGVELKYFKEENEYRLDDPSPRRKIGIGECYILSKLLLDSRPLRTDDQAHVLEILCSQLSPGERARMKPAMQRAPAVPSCLEKASVKRIEDLLFSIERADRISLRFGPGYRESCCAPYSVEFRGRKTYLVGWEIEKVPPPCTRWMTSPTMFRRTGPTR